MVDRLRLFDENDPGTLRLKNDLALTYNKKCGDHERVITLYEEVVAGSILTLGEGHPETLNSQNNLAVAYLAAERFDLAVRLSEKVVEMGAQLVDSGHPVLLRWQQGLASAYLMVGNIEAAATLCSKTLAAREQVLGLTDPETIESRYALAEAYLQLRQYADAIVQLEQVLVDSENVFDRSHQMIVFTRANLGFAYVVTGRKRKGIDLCRLNFIDCRRLLGAENWLTRAAKVALDGVNNVP